MSQLRLDEAQPLFDLFKPQFDAVEPLVEAQSFAVQGMYAPLEYGAFEWL
jgi:hypothetical protein